MFRNNNSHFASSIGGFFQVEIEYSYIKGDVKQKKPFCIKNQYGNTGNLSSSMIA